MPTPSFDIFGGGRCCVGAPDKLTSAEMDRWCRDFDNWGITDTVCFSLFDLSPLAWKKVAQWARKKEEFVKKGVSWALRQFNRSLLLTV